MPFFYCLPSVRQVVKLIVRVQQAEEAEKSKPPMISTCKAIVGAVIERDVDPEDRKRTWKADAQACTDQGSVETARAIYKHALKVFPGKKSIWRAAARLEKMHGSRESLDELLSRATQYCPQVQLYFESFPMIHELSNLLNTVARRLRC